MESRIERDSLGEVEVPKDAYWGSQTERSRQLFKISGTICDPRLIEAYVLLKKAAVVTNAELDLITKEQGDAIARAADQILAGELRDQFPIDAFHMGAGTSLHMNVNEVLANRAEELLGGQKGEYKLVNPNDHVNFGQSTNDTFPTAMRMMSRQILSELQDETERLAESFAKKGEEFDGVLKSGRTHLQDAVPIRLGQEFAAYGAAIKRCGTHLDFAAHELEVLGIGGTAVGTGLNSHPDYRARVVERLKEHTGFDYRTADDMREAMQSQLPMSALAGAVRITCLELTRITNDIRLLSSGPLTGLAEITLPAVQPGSSIMPGKVNPSVPECFNMVLYQTLGQCHAIDMAVQAGQLELNVMMPGMAYASAFGMTILTNGMAIMREHCIDGITANEEQCRKYAESSPSLATALNTYIGYSEASRVVKKALASERTIPEVVLDEGLLDEETLKRALDPKELTEPGIPGK